jgi:hypothetical protein
MIPRLLALALLLLSAAVQAASLEDLSAKEAGGGIREALTQGADAAVDQLGKRDGFFGNPSVRIPLPDKLQRAADLMRRFGMGDYADELELAMNRAAEAAVPEARDILIGAVRQMTFADAKSILTGGDDAATQYFKRTTSARLGAKFRPIVQRSMATVDLAQKYDRFAGSAARLNLIPEEDASIDAYVTNKALDGLYRIIAEEEKKIRADPLGAAGNLAKKVFSLIR